jgi:hypothetical protein
MAAVLNGASQISGAGTDAGSNLPARRNLFAYDDHIAWSHGIHHADLVTEQRKSVLSVPVEAIDGSGDSASVYTVGPSGMIEIVPVHLGSKPRSESRFDPEI